MVRFEFALRRPALSWSLGVACAPVSWTRAGHLAAKIFRKHARTNVFGALPSTTRALLRIFHRDEPDSSHGSLRGFGQPVFRLGCWTGNYYQLHSCLSRFYLGLVA
jgi:hypothetical protein